LETREAIRVIPEITRDIGQRGKSNSPPLNLPEPHSASPGNTEGYSRRLVEVQPDNC
jgi:hypothetical protein